MTASDLLLLESPGDGWTVQSGTSPHRLFVYQRSRLVGETVYRVVKTVSEHEVQMSHGGLIVGLIEQEVQQELAAAPPTIACEGECPHETHASDS